MATDASLRAGEVVQEQADGHAGPVRVRLQLCCQSPGTVALCSPQRERGREV